MATPEESSVPGFNESYMQINPDIPTDFSQRRFTSRAGDRGYFYNLGGFEELGAPGTTLGPVQPSVPELKSET